jgi:hypothetical protein
MFELLAAGEFRVVRIGRRRLLPVKALEEWVEARSEGPLATGSATERLAGPESGANSDLTSEYRNRSGR